LVTLHRLIKTKLKLLQLNKNKDYGNADMYKRN